MEGMLFKISPHLVFSARKASWSGIRLAGATENAKY